MLCLQPLTAETPLGWIIAVGLRGPRSAPRLTTAAKPACGTRLVLLAVGPEWKLARQAATRTPIRWDKAVAPLLIFVVITGGGAPCWLIIVKSHAIGVFLAFIDERKRALPAIRIATVGSHQVRSTVAPVVRVCRGRRPAPGMGRRGATGRRAWVDRFSALVVFDILVNKGKDAGTLIGLRFSCGLLEILQVQCGCWHVIICTVRRNSHANIKDARLSAEKQSDGVFWLP